MSRPALYAAVQELMDDPEASPSIRRAADYFIIRPSSFVDLLDRCDDCPTNEAEAAVALLSSLFTVVSRKGAEAKQDPYRFDEVALLLQSCEGLAERVKSIWHELQLTISSCSRALSLSAASSSFSIGVSSAQSPLNHAEAATASCAAGDSRLSTTLAQARHALTAMHETVRDFCSDAVKLLRYNSLGVELTNVIHLIVAKDDIARLAPNDRLKLTDAVCRELQCKLERVWFADFLENMGSSGLLPGEALRKLQDRWLSQWNLRKTIEQSTCFASLRRSQDLIRACVKSFPIASKVSDSDMSFFFTPKTTTATANLSFSAEGLAGNSVAEELSSPPTKFEEIFLRQRSRAKEEQTRRAQSAGGYSIASSPSQSAAVKGSNKQAQILASRLRPRHMMYSTLVSASEFQ